MVLTGAGSRLLDQYESLLNGPKRIKPSVEYVQRQQQHRLTAAEAVAVARAYQAGKNMKQVAQQFGVHRTTVAGCLRKLGVPLRRQGLAPVELEQAAALYRQGWSLVRLGEKFDCDAETVRQRFKQAGVVRRKPHER